MAGQIPQRVAVSSATGMAGNAINTAKLSNSMQGDKELQFTLTNGHASAARTNVKMFVGCWRTTTESEVPGTDVTFSSEGFASWEAFVKYFKEVSTNMYGVRITTTDVANFQSSLIFTEKDPTGKTTEVKRLLSKYRVPVGTGYSETIELTEDDLNFLIWGGLEVLFSSLKAQTSVTFYFKIRGWNKVKELNSLPNDIIA